MWGFHRFLMHSHQTENPQIHWNPKPTWKKKWKKKRQTLSQSPIWGFLIPLDGGKKSQGVPNWASLWVAKPGAVRSTTAPSARWHWSLVGIKLSGDCHANAMAFSLCESCKLPLIHVDYVDYVDWFMFPLIITSCESMLVDVDWIASGNVHHGLLDKNSMMFARNLWFGDFPASHVW